MSTLTNLVNRFRHRKVATFHFDQLTFQGHPDFGYLFAIHHATVDHDPFLVLKEIATGEYLTYHYDHINNMYADLDYIQIMYSDWVTRGAYPELAPTIDL